MKTTLLLFRIVAMALITSLLLSCDSFSGKTATNKTFALNKFLLHAIDSPKASIVICHLMNNSDSIYYIPKDASISVGKDTLYVEAIYKRRKPDDKIISYNLFNPPKLDLLKADSEITKKISYKNLTTKKLLYISVRIFKAKNPFDPKTDFSKYHSIEGFLNYEKQYSTLLTVKLEGL